MKREWCGSHVGGCNPRNRGSPLGRCAGCVDCWGREEPAAIFVNGDLTRHGVAADYAEYHDATAIWRDHHLRVYPAPGKWEVRDRFELTLPP
jgi:hypothetical protein